MRYHRYNVHFAFVKGTELLIADRLSRAHRDDSGNEQGDRARNHGCQCVCLVTFQASDLMRKNRLTSRDANLQSVMKLVMEGWLADKRQTPVCVLQYFDFRECLSVGDGILLKEEAVVIRMALRPSLIKRRIPSAQLGRESMLRRDRGTVYRPNMASDIKEIADICEACQEMKPRNPSEPLKQHSDGDEPG